MGTPKRALILPETIGRYSIERLLGKGGQGIVLLARDRELDRRVAVKLLKPNESHEDGTLVREARIVSGLQHPNIVTLHDVGIYNGMQYLVFEYIDGESLESRLRTSGNFTLAESVIMMSQILAGVAYLHENDIVHRDLSPPNIMIGKNGIPKVTDFGLSVLTHQLRRPGAGVSGTLRYMSPEPFKEQPLGPHSDVFTMASVFFEMLTGTRLFDAATPDEVIRAITEGEPIDLRGHAVEVSSIVARVLECASAREVADRYPHARAMKNALDEYRLPRDGDGASGNHSTVDFLLRRMSHKQGFSSLSQHIAEVLKITSDDSVAPANRLVNIIAKDITLTQRILTMANSAYYGNAEINALGRAVVLLGVDQVRMCITSALLENEFELGSAALREAMLKSFHSAIFAKEIAGSCEIRNSADAFTCAMFHDLGRTLTIHYLADEFNAILASSRRTHNDELTESREVLGVPYHEIGIAVGTHWKFANTIIASMRPLPRGMLEKLASLDERLPTCAAYANAVSGTVMDYEEPETRDIALEHLNERVVRALAPTADDFSSALAQASILTAQYARLIKIKLEDSEAAQRLLAFTPLAGAA
ncbi:MAG: protein kinase [Gammaproteobacteria bacterium]|nr:protein kinase [Gammaproteobacteria bacterium]